MVTTYSTTYDATDPGVINGTSGDDRIDTSYFDLEGDTPEWYGQDEIVFAGAGNDFIDLASGNDIIVYESGNDFIKAGKGFDTLDLQQYRSDEVTISQYGYHTLITTPDGTITLNYQMRYLLDDRPSAVKNIDQIVFSNLTLDVRDIEDASLSLIDTATFQIVTGTSGNDFIDSSYVDAEGDSIDWRGRNEVVHAGAGDDVVILDSGNDVIVYESGNDFIKAGKGIDTLDLANYASTDVTFGVDGHNLTINTPDGEITIYYQFRNENSPSLEFVEFSDDSMNASQMHQRALDDQSSTGDDHITGTRLTDTVTDLGGNDSIDTGRGDDTIIFDSGNDIIKGGIGFDTLDLSKYNSTDVSFSQNGYNTMIETADGDITLYYQMRETLSDAPYANKSIEQIVFADVTYNAQDIEDATLGMFTGIV